MSSPSPRIDTPRLRLRPHELGDLDAVHALFSDPGVAAAIGISPATRTEAWQRLLRHAGHWHLMGWGSFVVLDRADGRFLGQVGFSRYERGLGPRFDPYPEASWVLAPQAQGRGVATEALGAALNWMSAAGMGGRTVCLIGAENTPSLKVAARCGYHVFGRGRHKDREAALLERDATAAAP